MLMVSRAFLIRKPDVNTCDPSPPFLSWPYAVAQFKTQPLYQDGSLPPYSFR